MTVKLILRDKEFEVKPGMTLLSSLQKVNVLPESVIATREGEMILEDEILKDGDVVKLIAVISGGTGNCILFPDSDSRITNIEYLITLVSANIKRKKRFLGCFLLFARGALWVNEQ
jgi:sulfur carrier protein ThiS